MLQKMSVAATLAAALLLWNQGPSKEGTVWLRTVFVGKDPDVVRKLSDVKEKNALLLEAKQKSFSVEERKSTAYFIDENLIYTEQMRNLESLLRILDRGKLPIVIDLSTLSPGDREAIIDIFCRSGIRLPIAWNIIHAPDAKISIEPYAELQIIGEQGRVHALELRPGQGHSSLGSTVIPSVNGTDLLSKIASNDPSVRVPEAVLKKYTQQEITYLFKGSSIKPADQILMVNQIADIIKMKSEQKEKEINGKIKAILSRLAGSIELFDLVGKEVEYVDLDSSSQAALVDMLKLRCRELGLSKPDEVEAWARTRKVKVTRASIEVGFNFNDGGLIRGAFFDLNIIK